MAKIYSCTHAAIFNFISYFRFLGHLSHSGHWSSPVAVRCALSVNYFTFHFFLKTTLPIVIMASGSGVQILGQGEYDHIENM